MNPTIAQQIKSIKLRIVETIIPELREDATFAREQAAFIVMSLDWLMLTHAHQYRYEVVEHLEYRDLLRQMSTIGEADDNLLAEIRQALLAKGPAPEEASIPVDELILQTRRLKQLTARLFGSLCDQSEESAQAARQMLGEMSVKQGNRELAFFEGTGFTSSREKLGVLLGSSSDTAEHV